MLRRPKPGDDEDDILRMQEEFLKNKNEPPSVQVVNLRKTEHQTTKRTSPTTSQARKPSKYAQSKSLNASDKRPRTEETKTTTTNLLGDILEKNIAKNNSKLEDNDDKVYYPQILPSVLGEIVEKNCDDVINYDIQKMPATGFPIASKRVSNLQMVNSVQNIAQDKYDMNVDQSSNGAQNNLNLPSQSYIVSSKEAAKIHAENINLLSKLSEKEILEEKQKLLSSIDSNLINFIKNKRNKKNLNMQTDTDPSSEDLKHQEKLNVTGSSSEFDSTFNDTFWDNDVLSHPQVNSWLNFNNLEKDKLEWLKGIKERHKVNPDDPYEARFDFKGYLLPYTIEYTEKTKTLFHHGEEPHRPGYSITELFELSRSSIIQQRVMALNTLAGILEYNSIGTYKNIIDVPLAKIFFVIRIALDDNKTITLEPALKAMRNLLFNRIDEACLDALIGFEEGCYQPCLENDKSEIEEIESKESEIKDYHLAEIDIIAAILRTDILQRLYYIFETIKPSFNSVQYSLQILIRLARDSVETSYKIAQMDYLINAIVKNFIPPTSVNFVFDASIVYNGKPILAALKLIRILTLQSEEFGETLITKHDILKSLSMYISSGVDSTYGLRLQIEAFSIFTNLLMYDLGIDAIQALYPLIITTLYKHVQGTDVFINTSVVTVTHAAVVVQFINKLLNSRRLNLDNFKGQIYPLLKDGIQKWIMQVAHIDCYTCGHLRLVSSVMDCCKSILIIESTSLPFVNNSLKTLANSNGFQIIISNLLQSSNLLSEIEDKHLNLIKNLVSLGSSVIDSSQKVLPILNVTSSIPFLLSLYELLLCINDKEIIKVFIDKTVQYLMKLSNKSVSLCNNWFTRMEVNLVFCILKLSTNVFVSNSQESLCDVIYGVANKLCYILRVDKQNELQYLFDNIVFNKQWFTTERLFNLVSLSKTDEFSKALSTVEEIKLCYSKVLNLKHLDTKLGMVLKTWQSPILPRDWIYLPILNLYSKSQEVEHIPQITGVHAQKIAQQISNDKELIIRCSLEWILFNEVCFTDLLSDIDVTDRFCRIMCVFLCDNSLFLNDKIKKLLYECTQVLFRYGNNFNFDKQLTGLHNFQDLYTQFLEHFQSVSYGDPTFAACVLVPLTQRHNNKWRKLLWSEYAGCLRALDCPESYLCYEFKDYLYPEETDESLLKSYFRCISSKLLRPDTIVYKIAHHHIECYKKRKGNK